MRLNASGPLKACLIFALALGGCSANNNSIYRMRAVSGADPTIVTVDAKQRHLIASPGTAGANGTAARAPQFCTEPPPDVFSVYAQALGANAALGKSDDPATLDAKLGFSYSSSEQGATIARALALNMFNYRNYSTCLKAMNGMVGNLEMPIIEARDQRSAVSWMAIDGLTAALTPKPTIIGASGSAVTGASSDSVSHIANAGSAMDGARTAEAAAKKTFDELNGSVKCDALAAKAPPLTDTTEIANNTKCVEARTALNNATEKRTQAEDRYATLKEAMQKSSIMASATVSAPGSDQQDEEDKRAANIEKVANVVKAIVKMAYDQDETQLFCIRMLSATPGGSTQADRVAAAGGDAVLGNCVKYLLIKTEAESARNLQMLGADDQDRVLQEFNDTNVSLLRADTSLFEKFWARVAVSPSAQTADPSKLSAVVTAKLGQNGNADIPPVARSLRNMLQTDKQAAYSAFRRLDNSTKTELAEGR